MSTKDQLDDQLKDQLCRDLFGSTDEISIALTDKMELSNHFNARINNEYLLDNDPLCSQLMSQLLSQIEKECEE